MMQHSVQWDQIKTAFANQRVPQAMLFAGPLHCNLEHFVTQVMKFFHCQNTQNKPCGECMDCRMVERFEHPDVEWVKSEKKEGLIKIEAIRALQNSIYLTPKCAHFRLIVIESADRMNTSSANALLKILEEPAKHTIFILIARQLSTVLPTVLSRCQLFRFSSSADDLTSNLLTLGLHYPPDSDQALIIQQSETILENLIALVEGHLHPCNIASQWAQFEPGVLLWFLYLVYAQLLYIHMNQRDLTGPAINQLVKLGSLLNPVLIFEQISKINNLLRKISHNVTMNNTLALEDLLFALI